MATEDIPQIRRIINQVLYRAVVEGASDIHIENLENRIRVRFRLDGLLQERKTTITKDNVRSVISVFKVDAGLDITEHRRSQDGVFKMSVGKGRFVDFRINLHSTRFWARCGYPNSGYLEEFVASGSLGLSSRDAGALPTFGRKPSGIDPVDGTHRQWQEHHTLFTLAHLNSAEKKSSPLKIRWSITWMGFVSTK